MQQYKGKQRRRKRRKGREKRREQKMSKSRRREFGGPVINVSNRFVYVCAWAGIEPIEKQATW